MKKILYKSSLMALLGVFSFSAAQAGEIKRQTTVIDDSLIMAKLKISPLYPEKKSPFGFSLDKINVEPMNFDVAAVTAPKWEPNHTPRSTDSAPLSVLKPNGLASIQKSSLDNFKVAVNNSTKNNKPALKTKKYLPSISKTTRPNAWIAPKNTQLKNVLEDWAKKSDWSVSWQSQHSYQLVASGQFEGTFKEAASKILNAFSDASPPVQGEFYEGNKVLVISTPIDFQ